MRHAVIFFLKVTFFQLVVLILMSACTDIHSKKEHLSTIQLDRGLYNELYRVYSGGVWAGNTNTEYLTDSLCFRKYLGYTNDNERFEIVFIDSVRISVCKVNISQKDTVECQIYNISLLKEEGRFE